MTYGRDVRLVKEVMVELMIPEKTLDICHGPANCHMMCQVLLRKSGVHTTATEAVVLVTADTGMFTSVPGATNVCGVMNVMGTLTMLLACV
jgi:hypothetical protein